ncbi:MAG: DUF2834 domain-containing protein [Pseudanabaena sp. ELA607]|jgi:hypothetical protein
MTDVSSSSVVRFELTLPRLALFLLWLGFGIYAFGFAPADQPNTPELIKRLVVGQWQGIDGYVVCLFNLMGVLPAIYAAVLCTEGKRQRVPTGLFVGLSFFVGAFAMLPYLVLRHPEPQIVLDVSNKSDEPNLTSATNAELTALANQTKPKWWAKAFGGKFTGIILVMITSYFLYYGWQQGNFNDFIQLWQRDRFIHVMGLDFCLLNSLLPIILWDDLSRRNCRQGKWLWWCLGLPLIGPLLYLCIRPPVNYVYQPTDT